MGTVNSGVARLTPKDLLKIKGLTKKVVALNRRRIPKNRRLKDAHRIIIDSGATISLLRKHRWLRQLATRLTAIVKTATGEATKTEAHGAIQIMTRNSKGEHMKLKDIGEGHLLRDITFSLMSVSQLCDHGMTVVFKPKEAYMITKDGEKIPFSRERGLYFRPTDKDSAGEDDGTFVNNLSAARPVDESTMEPTSRSASSTEKSDRKVKQTMRMLKRAGYDYQAVRSLRLGPDCIADCLHAAAARRSLHRRQGRARKYHVSVMTRGQRSAAATTASEANSGREAGKSPSESKRAKTREGHEM